MSEDINGMFYENSRTRMKDVSDGLSTTIMVGERSSEIFDSSWAGIVKDSDYTGWRVVGWTGEPPNYEGGSEVHFHGYAQFNSQHAGGITNFVFADGSVHGIHEGIDSKVFLALGTITGGEIVDSESFR